MFYHKKNLSNLYLTLCSQPSSVLSVISVVKKAGVLGIGGSGKKVCKSAA